jgi:glycosyltransferase involved in cell wall biosynthesis
MKKVVNLVPDQGYAGIQQVANLLDDAFNKAGWSSHTVSVAEFFPTKETPKLVKFLVAGMSLNGRLREVGADVIIVHNVYAFLLVMFSRASLVLTLHGPINVESAPEMGFRRKARLLLHYLCFLRAVRIISVSQGLASEIPRVFSKKTEIVLNAPSKAFFCEAAEKTRFAFMRRTTGVRLVQFGRLHFQKNQSHSIDLVRKLKSRGVGAKLCIIGSGPDEYMLKRHAGGVGLSYGNISDDSVDDCDVVFSGPIAGLSWMKDVFDIALFPSRFEGFNISLIECASIGLPVVASSCKWGHDEIFAKLVKQVGSVEEAEKYIVLVDVEVDSRGSLDRWADCVTKMTLNKQVKKRALFCARDLQREMGNDWVDIVRKLRSAPRRCERAADD